MENQQPGYYFFVDWKKVKTWDDMKVILAALELRFLKGTAQFEMVKEYLLYEEDKDA